MIRKAIIVALTLATLGTGLMWADSYRVRDLKPIPPEVRELLGNITGLISLNPRDRLGWGLSRNFGIDMSLGLGTCAGKLSLRYDTAVEMGARVPLKDIRFCGFGYEQRKWTSSIGWEPKLGREISSDYLVREVTLPFPVLFAGFAWYPARAFVRDPLRRYRRRRRGLCLKCGYDLTGNESGNCPECGNVI